MLESCMGRQQYNHIWSVTLCFGKGSGQRNMEMTSLLSCLVASILRVKTIGLVIRKWLGASTGARTRNSRLFLASCTFFPYRESLSSYSSCMHCMYILKHHVYNRYCEHNLLDFKTWYTQRERTCPQFHYCMGNSNGNYPYCHVPWCFNITHTLHGFML